MCSRVVFDLVPEEGFQQPLILWGPECHHDLIPIIHEGLEIVSGHVHIQKILEVHDRYFLRWNPVVVVDESHDLTALQQSLFQGVPFFQQPDRPTNISHKDLCTSR